MSRDKQVGISGDDDRTLASVSEAAAAPCAFRIFPVVLVYVRIYEPGKETPGETVYFIDRRHSDTGMVCMVA